MVTAPTDQPRRTPTAIDEAATAYMYKLYELDPSLATINGETGHETEYADYSPSGAEAYAQATREALATITSLPIEDAIDVVTVDAMSERLGLDLEIHEAGYDVGELNNLACPAQDIRSVFDLMPTDTEQQWSHIAGRLANVPGAIDGYIESLKYAAEQGRVSAVRQVDAVIEQADRYIADDGYFAMLVGGARTAEGELPAELQQELQDSSDAARTGYAKLRDFLRDELRPQAPEKDAVGRERYALASRKFLGSEIDLEETYAWGVEELDRIIAEQEAVAERIKPGASVAEAVQILDADPERQLHGTDELKAWMQAVSDAAIAELAQSHFEIPEPLRTLECCIAPTNEGSIYYTGPSDDFARPGRMWWSVPEGADTFGTWREKTTVYHEGVPGHHLQTGYQVYAKELLNAWRRHGCWVPGQGEGWALYAERLMTDLGYLDDDGDRLGMLDAQRMRAARVVFDIGVHFELEVPERWGTGTWTPEKGRAFLRENIAVSEGELNFEFTRYLGWPGQAPSYKIGERLLEQIRDEVQASEGADWDAKRFHTRVLELGSPGLDTLRRALLPS